MPRPPRIEYPHAFYHIMNRGKGRKDIFHDKEYYQTFLDLIAKAHDRFGIIVHAYCLMTNHYHLLIETPDANLSNAMQYINSMYVQKYNKLQKIDGQLFKGRFKAILADEGCYLTLLNKYIHRNPIEIKSKNKLVKKLSDYKWSSYPVYLNKAKKPSWLNTSKTLEMLNMNDNTSNYRKYIEESESDETIKKFYSQTNLLGILGDKVFKNKVFELISNQDSEKDFQTNYKVKLNITSNQIINSVAKVFKVTKSSITDIKKSRTANNPRKLAIYLCQKDGRLTLNQISKEFNLSNAGSVSYAIYSIKNEIDKGIFKEVIKDVEKCY